MKTYTATKAFTILPQQFVVEAGMSISKFSDSVLVVIDGRYFTKSTFYSWIGSEDSSNVMSFVSETPDTTNPLALSEIDVNSNFHTYDIINLLNSVVRYVQT